MSGGRVRVGFVNIKEKPPKTYYLYEGEQQDGIEVMEVDYRNSVALLRSGDETRELRMTTASINTMQTTKVPRTTKPAARTVAKSSAPGQNGEPQEPQSLAEKMKLRRLLEEEMRLRMAHNKRQFTPEELRQLFEEKQMHYIRTDQPLLPLQLTPEMDTQLVREGFLEPL